MTADSLQSTDEARSSTVSRRRIDELDGLRGLALVLVVAFHLAGDGRVSGGVDVFLVVSGFLSTLIIMRRVRTGTFSATRQIANTLRRLVPASLLVLGATLVVALLVLPPTHLSTIASHVAAAAVGIENWEMIRSGISYEAVGPRANPVQHFWSLSIQLQFLVLWPLVVLACRRLARARGARPEHVVAVVACAAGAASFAFATWSSATDQQVSYFSSLTRFWELAVGAGLALAYPALAVGRRTGTTLTVVGLGLLLTCGFVMDGSLHFPGPWALWPVLAGVAVIVATTSTSPLPGTLLANRPWRFVARHSYSLYLWHWPIMVLSLSFRKRPDLDLEGALAVLALSALLAWATTRWVTEPAVRSADRFSPGGVTAVSTGASLVLATVSVATVGLVGQRAQQEILLAADRTTYVGAPALSGAPVPSATPRPAPDVAPFDSIAAEGCAQSALREARYDEALVCDLSAGDPGGREVMLVGGSHVEHWTPTLQAIAQTRGWRLSAVIKHGCRLEIDPDGAGCTAWSRNALEIVGRRAPELVVVVGSHTAWTEPERPATAAQLSAWEAVAALGPEVVALRDTPRFTGSVPECLLERPTADACDRPQSEVYQSWSTIRSAGTPAHQVDVSELFCADSTCTGIIGNVVAYRDGDHITATYARTLDDLLDTMLRDLDLEIYRP